MALIHYIIKRNGQKVPFDKARIFSAIEKAFLSENKVDTAAVAKLTEEVVYAMIARSGNNDTTIVESVQDVVEEMLMKAGYHKIARNYIVYREMHKQVRQQKVLDKIREKQLQVKVSETETVIFDSKSIEEQLRQLAPDLMRVSITEMVEAVTKQVYDNIPKHEIDLLVLTAARERIELHYDYAHLASRIAISNELYGKILGEPMNSPRLAELYKEKFADYVAKGISYEMLNPELAGFDLEKLAAALNPERDKLFYYLGVQILIDRYFLRDRSLEKNIYELPQWFWMRVAMGLALKEADKEARAIEFYNVLSQMDLVSSTPTLFNSGTTHSQMSSCYLNLAGDSLNSIFKLYADNANLSKWAGGIGSDFTYVRATGSKIKGTNGMSQGVIPFIKIFNDVALAVNQGGKRKGAMCAYMEMWHLDYEQFLELKKNTGDERRRAHDVNTASWIPDLFMKRVQQDQDWTFFCPADVPELHDLYGKAFEAKYVEYEAANLPRAKKVKALDLWRKMLTMLYETGHPWMTFKDAANVRNPQDHCGVIHSSNLCTEITLNTSKDETAVCNLASLNLARMIKDGALDEAKIAKTVEVGIRMLDNVIDNNFYPIPEAEKANFRHRAVGLGLMGYQDALFQVGIAFDSEANLEFADQSMEMISYYAIKASALLAQERGTYPSYDGSKWSRGLFPLDTLMVLEEQRGQAIQVNKAQRLDWAALKAQVAQHGMRNSNTMAIAPTATIANISGVYPCTEPVYKNIYMKENLSGNFIVINRYLIDELEKLGLWNPDMVAKIKLYNGSIQDIEEIPVAIKAKYKETFEIDGKWIIGAAARRSKWIDQAASTNVFSNTTSGKALSDIYMAAWEQGLKTTYYLRTLGASQITKMSVTDAVVAEKPAVEQPVPAEMPKACLINDPDCEACQ
ncbi:MAG: ribonucleoside-diphosphate reductase subunit alpha [Candidatus Margulisiibacteriota bacterium]